MPNPPAVHVEGLDEFRAGLKHANNPRAFKTELKKEERVIATEVAQTARGIASGMGGPFAHFAGAIVGKSTVQGASIGLGGPYANDTFWGGKATTGWNAGNDGARQHPEWVGASWDVKEGQGPYALVPAIVELEPKIVHDYGVAVDRVTHQAFPNKGGESF